MNVHQDPANGRLVSPYPADQDGERWCPECGAYVSVVHFYSDSRASSGLTRRCKVHHSTKSYESRKRTPANIRKARERVRKKIYGLSPEEYEKMVEDQGGVCAICEQPPTESWGLSVDHDHETGEIRGLLCGPCNRGLGQFKDDLPNLRRAVLYLERIVT